MVSKLAKELRKQAIARAEKYKQEQVAKVEELQKEKPKQALAPAPVLVIRPTRDDKTSGDGKLANATHSIPAVKKDLLGLPSSDDTTNGPAVDIVTEKLNPQKAFAGKKKKRHAHIKPAPRDDPSRYRKPTSTPPSSTSYSMVGGIAAESFITPTASHANATSPIPHQSMHNTSPSAHTAQRASFPSVETTCQQPELKSIGAGREAMPKKVDEKSSEPPYQFHNLASAQPGFTFKPASPSICTMKRSVPLLPQPSVFGFAEDFKHPEKQDPVVIEQRSVFAKLGHINQDTTMPPSLPHMTVLALINPPTVVFPSLLAPSPAPQDHQTLSPSTDEPCLLMGPLPLPLESASSSQAHDNKLHDDIIQDLFHGPRNRISTCLLSWCLGEVTQRYQAEISTINEEQSSSATSASVRIKDCLPTVAPEAMALVHYYPPLASVLKAARLLNHHRRGSDSPGGLWDANRIFFTTADGHTRLVDRTQSMYEHDVDVLVDDGGSDFDSVASPVKIDLIPVPMSDLSERSSSEDESEDYTSDGTFADLYEMDCKFYTYHTNLVFTTSNKSLEVSYDEDVIDPCLVFNASLNHGDQGLVIDTTMEPLEAILIDGLESTLSAPVAGSPSEVPATKSEELSGDLCKMDSPSTLVDADALLHIDAATGSDKLLIIDAADHYYDLEDKPPIGLEDTTDPATVQADQEPFTSDWASEICRLTLGTESLFTFLLHLETTEDGTTTKSAITSAFLKLVNLEREKLAERPLAASYTAANVLTSNIVPHTIFLGTTSLATFLSKFMFGDDGTTELKEVYRVYKLMRKEDLRLQVLATTGMMGELGRSLGKLGRE